MPSRVRRFASRALVVAALLGAAACAGGDRTSDPVDEASGAQAEPGGQSAAPVPGSPEEAALLDSLAVPIVYSD
ncbi:MAG: hypothetical protein RLZ40_441, partial [Actinomycetota bacterium]